MMRKRDFAYDDRPDIGSSYGKRPRSDSRDKSPLRYGKEMPMTTSNPITVSARIFVGSIPPDMTREVLENHFSRWGVIIAASVTKHGFGFVQFKKESQALACLSSGHATIVDGFRLDIKPAKQGSGYFQSAVEREPFEVDWGSDSLPKQFGSTRDNVRGSNQYDSFYGESGDSRDRELLERGGNRGGGFNHRERGGAFGERGRGGGGGPLRDQNLWDNSSESSLYGRGNGFGEPKSEFASASARSTFDPTSAADLMATARSTFDPTSAADLINREDDVRPNDVEIVVPNKSQRGYAERIEARLKQFDLSIDLLFPPPNITADRVIKDLSSRNCLYAVFATAENEKHNSLTLNILHGDPQEHRNMPVDDAMRLIQQNFEEYLKKTRQRRMRDVVPMDIRNLVVELLEMKPLSMGDLDKMIKYLRERQNSLVDNQIEQKRETVVGQMSQATASVTRSMTVTYPGYNYIAATAVPATPASIVTASSIPGLAVTYPASAAYGTGLAEVQTAQNLSATNIQASMTGGLNAYSIQQHQLASSQVVPQQTFTLSSIPANSSNNKQAELQERILSLLNNQNAAVPVTRPTGVPAPIGGIPGANMTSQSTVPWRSRLQPTQQSGQNAYNPWTL